ncbi:hypothetical protein PAMP_009780 [Pampus punctatissimus]
MILHKVCNISVCCLEAQWVKTFYKKLSQLIKDKIECRTEDDVQEAQKDEPSSKSKKTEKKKRSVSDSCWADPLTETDKREVLRKGKRREMMQRLKQRGRGKRNTRRN